MCKHCGRMLLFRDGAYVHERTGSPTCSFWAPGNHALGEGRWVPRTPRTTAEWTRITDEVLRGWR